MVLQTGFYALLILICGLIYGAYIGIKNKKTLLAIISTSVLLIMIGYSTYFTIFIRRIKDKKIIEEPVPDTSGSITWSYDDKYFFILSWINIIEQKKFTGTSLVLP